MSRLLIPIILALASIVAEAAPIGSVAAGTVIYVEGRVFVTRAEGRIPVALNSAVFSGDTLETDKQSSVRLQMADKSYFALTQNSIFRIDKFDMPALISRQKAPGVALLSLLKGGLRAISGLIGHSRGDNFLLTTPVATMGIRGTEYIVAYNTDAAGAGKGLYVSVISGEVSLKNAAGEVSVKEGGVSYAAFPSADGVSELPQAISELPASIVAESGGAFNPEAKIDQAHADSKSGDDASKAEDKSDSQTNDNQQQDTSPSQAPPASPQRSLPDEPVSPS